MLKYTELANGFRVHKYKIVQIMYSYNIVVAFPSRFGRRLRTKTKKINFPALVPRQVVAITFHGNLSVTLKTI